MYDSLFLLQHSDILTFSCSLFAASVQGRIVLVVRGKCTFDQKREIVRKAGGVAMLVANTQVKTKDFHD